MPRAHSETPTMPRWGLPLHTYEEVSHFKSISFRADCSNLVKQQLIHINITTMAYYIQL